MPEPFPAPEPTGARAPEAPVQAADASAQALHDLVLRSLDDDQAVEIVSIPLTGKSSIADFMVIASGRSSATSAPATPMRPSKR